MRYISILLVTLVIPAFAFANDNGLRVVYKHYDFYPPANPVAVGFLGSDNNTLIFKYSPDAGDNIVGFSTEDELNTGGCDPEAFFTNVLNKNNANCDELSLKTFRHVFAKDRETGIWSNGEYKFYYFLGKKHSTVFFIPNNIAAKIIKVDSNFLTKNEMKSLLRDYVQ
ncbi:hypothetical protein EZI54_16125 [Marinobacter halodurans]|uniref:Uncharacterized protein n=1 Tax=Marinobacter halodurans TaxID=2528979 RepID=A0ABY1ZJ95_9GAMM|nr:hypothetical protein [Marinobacter halodurans]TBW52567.1 hypothetical protein EZI54_16125 [Marinobacter halodurans]